MNVKVITPTDKLLEERDWSSFLDIEIDGKKEFGVADGEPEDATLARDFNNCVTIPRLMEMAYNAGKNGETFSVESEQVDERG